MFRKLRLRQKNGFLIKKHVFDEKNLLTGKAAFLINFIF